MKKYQHIIFDLDHTLWDFDRNSNIALQEVYIELELHHFGIDDFNEFYRRYKIINEECWADYRVNKIKKEVLRIIRFQRTLESYGVYDKILSETICESYLYKSPRKPHVIEGTYEVLTQLQKKYKLHILTNGFSEIQEIKMESSKLNTYFTHIIASEDAGEKKPHPQAFNFALDKIGSNINECIMIGDNPESDIDGARKIGMDTIYFNRNGAYSKDVVATYQINHLIEILPIL